MPNTAPAGSVDVSEQPLDLGPGEVGVDHEPGALADQVLVALLAELVAARRRAAVLPDEGVVDGLAGPRVPGDDGLALVRDPDPIQVGALHAGVGERLRRDLAGHLPDLGRVVLDPAGPREVLLELAVGAAARPALAVEDEAGRAGRPLVDRQDHGAGGYPRRLRMPARMSRSWRPRWRKPAGVRPVARWARADRSRRCGAGADGVDRHPGLEPEAAGEGEQLPQRARRASRAGPRAAPRSREPAEPLDRPSREADARRRSRRPRDARERARSRDRTSPPRPRRRARRARSRSRPRSASQSSTVASSGIVEGRLGRRGHVAPLPCGRRRLDQPGAVAHRDLGVPSVEASSATISRAPGERLGSASSAAPIRSASLRAATITTRAGSGVTAGYCAARVADVEAHITGTSGRSRSRSATRSTRATPSSSSSR